MKRKTSAPLGVLLGVLSGVLLVLGAASDLAAQGQGRASIGRFAPSEQVGRPLRVQLSAPDADTVYTADLELRGALSRPFPLWRSVECNDVAAVGEGGGFACRVELAAGDNLVLAVATTPDGRSVRDSVRVFYAPLPNIEILSPLPGAVFGAGAIDVDVAVDDAEAEIAVNGAAQGAGGRVNAQVALRPGANLIRVTARNRAGGVASAGVEVISDASPPRLSVVAPKNGSRVYSQNIAVTGAVNDLSAGTVNSAQVGVWVDGIEARVANRSFLAEGVALNEGENRVEVIARDAAGNADTAAVTVFYAAESTDPFLRVVAGDGQQAPIGGRLDEPAVVELLDADGQPLGDRPVLFRIVDNNGRLVGSRAADGRSLVAVTDARGRAQADWSLGTYVGAGLNRLEVTAPDAAGATVYFCATALAAAPDKINIDAGDQQVGAVNATLPEPLAVVVTDAGHNRLAGVPVVFRVLNGGGHFNGQIEYRVETDDHGRALALFTLGPHPGPANNAVGVDFAANTGAPARFTASGVVPRDPGLTRVSGVVLDPADEPIAGVRVHIAGTPLEGRTDEEGQFALDGAPVGRIHLEVDGTTAERSGVWPALEYELVTVPGADNDVGGPIYLLPLDIANGLSVGPESGGTLTLDEVPGFALEVAPGSATFPDGSTAGVVSVTPVHADKVPMVPNFGQQPRLVVTIQPAGVAFDPPAPLTLPNVDGLAPGEKTEMYSFDHDLGRFVSIGTGSVSADGTVIRSDPGTGVGKGGWHCGGNPQTTGSAERAHVKIVRFCDLDCVDVAQTPGPFTVSPDKRFYVEAKGGPDPGRYEWSVEGGAVRLVSGGPIGQFEVARAGRSTISVRFICQSGAPSAPASVVVQVNGVHIGIAGAVPPEDVLFVNDDFHEGKSASDLNDASPLRADGSSFAFDHLRRLETSIQPDGASDLAGATITLGNLGLGQVRVLAIRRTDRTWAEVPVAREGFTITAAGDTVLALQGGGNLRDDFFLPNGRYTAAAGYELYAEGLGPGAAELVLRLEKDGQAQDDTLRLKVFDVDVLLGAQDETDRSLHDDWVGADGHRIFNFILAQGPPNTQVGLLATFLNEVRVDIHMEEPDEVGEGTVRFIQPRRDLTTDGSGRAVQAFEIIGGHVSAFSEDVSIRVVSGDLVATEETMTVIKPLMGAETDGFGLTPLNPAVVNAVEAGVGGNLFGSTDRLNSIDQRFASTPVSNGGFALPKGLGASPKIAPDKIEVLWGRTAGGRSLNSVQDTGLRTPTAATDRSSGRAVVTGFRMQDTSLNANLAQGDTVRYFLGHPTGRRSELPDVHLNHAGSIVARFMPHLDYPVRLHLVVGPTLNSGISATQARAMLTDAGLIWSQAGVGFSLDSLVVHNLASDALLDANSATVGFGDVDDITALSPAPNAIDVFFVNRVIDTDGDDLNGLTILFSQHSTVFSREPGVVVGPNGSGFTANRKIEELTHTVAHELGHYLMDTSSHVDEKRVWNLMLAGGIDTGSGKTINRTKRDLDGEQADEVRDSDVTPTNTR